MATAWKGKAPGGMAATVPRARATRARRIQLPSWGVKPGDVINNKWIIREPIGKGSFGVVHVCQCLTTLQCFAIKIEQRERDKKGDINKTAQMERETLEALLNVEGFPAIRDYGIGEDYFWSVMTLLGATLETMLKICGGRFSVYTAVHIGDQVLTRIESLHRQRYVHRDIKPENFMLGLAESKKTVYMCDFGLAKAYMDKNDNHAPLRCKLPLIGTIRYASSYNHRGYEQGRRDDLESWWYMIIYFIMGSLPWQSVVGTNIKDKKNKVLALKVNIPINFQRALPAGFMNILFYIRSLDFDQVPNYDLIRNLLRQSLPYGFEGQEKVLYDWDFIGHFNHP